jgi:hypothetical protein
VTALDLLFRRPCVARAQFFPCRPVTQSPEKQRAKRRGGGLKTVLLGTVLFLAGTGLAAASHAPKQGLASWYGEGHRGKLMANGKAKSEEDIAEIEKVMLEKGITDHETAADYHNWMRQASKPTPVRSFSANVLDESARGTLEKFWKNPAMAARDEASKALNELRKNPRPIGL